MIWDGTIEFSADSQHLAYCAKRGDKPVVVIDGADGLECESILHHPVFSPNGKQCAYIIRRGSKSIAVIDGKEDRQYGLIGLAGQIQPPRLVFSPNSKRVAYTTGWGELKPFSGGIGMKEGNGFVVVDGVPGKEHRHIGMSLNFSPDSKRLAYSTTPRFARTSDDGYQIFIDGEPQKKFPNGISSSQFSPDSRRVAYAACRGDKWFVVVDGNEGEECDEVVRRDFSADSRQFAYIARNAGKDVLILDGKRSTPCDEITTGDRLFSPYGTRIAYAARRGENWTIVVDGQEGPQYDEIAKGAPMFSPDGQWLAYAARRGEKWFLVVHGAKNSEDQHYEAILQKNEKGSPKSGIYWHNSRLLRAIVVRDGKNLRVDVSVGKKNS